MKRITTIAAATLTVLVLAACSVSNPPPTGPPADAVPVTATSNPASAVDTWTFAPGEEEVYEVSVPANVGSDDLLYIELDRNISLEVLPASYASVEFSASSSAYFGTGLTGLTAAVADGSLSGQTVTTPVTCRGSCVILDAAPSTFYVRVVNTGAITMNDVNLYVYGDDYADETEGINDTPATGPNLVSFDSGAIETIGDVDYWYMPNNGNVQFDVVQNGIALEAEIVDSNGNRVPTSTGPYLDGDVIQVFAGEFLRIWTVDENRAAASANSQYYLEYQGGPAGESDRVR